MEPASSVGFSSSILPRCLNLPGGALTHLLPYYLPYGKATGSYVWGAIIQQAALKPMSLWVALLKRAWRSCCLSY